MSVRRAAALAQTGPAGPAVTPVDHNRIVNADKEPGNWLSHGRTYSEQRYSPLDQINADNVGKLGLAWFADIPVQRGMEATPIVVDGVPLHDVRVVDRLRARRQDRPSAVDLRSEGAARVGQERVLRRRQSRRRGVGRKVYVGTIDGRLDRARRRDRQAGLGCQHDRSRWPYTITGAPRVVKGKVIIGNGGAELGVRGYVTAYDAETGKQSGASTPCRAIPPKGFENAAMRERPRKPGTASGGNTAAAAPSGIRWPTIPSSTCSTSASATARRGTARSAARTAATICSSRRSSRSSRHRRVRLALPDDARRHLGLHRDAAHHADRHLTIDGTPRKVLMQAPKNGFFYVIDRTNGKLLSGRQLRADDLGRAASTRPAGRSRRRRRAIPIREAAADLPVAVRRPQLAPDGVFAEDRISSTCPAQEMPFVFGEDTELQVQARPVEPRHASSNTLHCPKTRRRSRKSCRC